MPQLQELKDKEERSKVWRQKQREIRRAEKEAEQRAEEERLANMTPDEIKECVGAKEWQVQHDKQRSKHLLLLAKSAGAKKGKNGRKKKGGRGKSR